MKWTLPFVFLVLGCGASGSKGPASPSSPVAGDVAGERTAEVASAQSAPEATAEQVAQRVLILDGHIDVPWRLEKSVNADGSLGEEISEATESGDFDYPRAKAGGLDAPFMSIYVSPKFEKRGAKKVADKLIDMVEGITKRAPSKFALAPTVASIRANFAAGKISLPMGMENGAPIEGELANVGYFHGRGIRYITLAHSEDNHIADSSYDTRHTHHGLSEFGTRVVQEMNRVGIMIDVSHISDEAFDDVMATTAVPVIASHSSCRHFTPGWERNMSDAMIRRLAANGGVIQINFGSTFLDGDIRQGREAHEEGLQRHLTAKKLDPESPGGQAEARAYSAEHPAPRATVAMVADHITHVISLVGVAHVGFGSDFDGVGDSLPEGLRDVSDYPNLIGELMARGHDAAAIEKIAGGNVLRVWQAAEDYAAAQPSH